MLNRSFAAALAGFVVLGCSGADADADGQARTAAARQAPETQAAPGAQEAQVTAVVGFPWGTPYDSIVARRGQPDMEQPEPEGVRAFTYDEQVLGRQMVAMLFVHPQHGLMRGGYMAPFNSPADCAIALQELDNVVTRRYPTLPIEVRGPSGQAGDICAATLSGQAGYGKVWSDDANGARIVLALMPRASGVMLTYTTAEADAWERRKNDARF